MNFNIIAWLAILCFSVGFSLLIITCVATLRPLKQTTLSIVGHFLLGVVFVLFSIYLGVHSIVPETSCTTDSECTQVGYELGYEEPWHTM